MNKPIGSLFTIAGVMALLVTFVPEAVLSSPALPLQGKACIVDDADMNQYLDLDCDFHLVFKLDEEGNIVGLLNYQDHGQLPPEAVFPDQAIQFIIHVDCQCIFDGDYQVTLSPNGEYHSHGPLNTQ
jgi:hypothetical protein